MRRYIVSPIFVLLSFAGSLWPQSFALKDGDTVVFYGDSITDQRLYTTFAETFVVTRFPNMPVRFVHSGWGGDRVTGGGGGPIDLRLRRDVLPYKPTVVTIMLGMNDGSYRAFDEQIFTRYATGYESIVHNLKAAIPGLRITVIEPSPYDDVTRQPTFEGGYNAVLVRYSQYLRELAAREHLGRADLNTPVVAMLQKAFATDPKLAEKILPDRVHPGPSGHLIMAEALLKSWGAPAVVTTVEIDGGAVKRAENTKVSDLNGLTWTQMDRALPMPIDKRDPAMGLAVASSDFVESLDRELLKVSGLGSGTYTLKIDGDSIGDFSREQLAAGINLAELQTPMTKQAADVHALTLKHNNVHFFRWRTLQTVLEADGYNTAASEASLDSLEDQIIGAQRMAAQPKPHKYELVQK
jgi:lysophospholipase L1-like esterase